MVVPDHHRRNRLCGYDTEVFDYQEGKPGGDSGKTVDRGADTACAD